ncbi:MAG TPA: hypothetical protein VII23_12240 [Terriglobales bacterium]
MARHFLFVLLLLYTVVGVAQPPVAQLPLTYIDTTFNPPSGVTWPAHSSADFKNALNSANPGDTIVLDAGVTYQGNFTLPVKANPLNKWIYIVGSALSSLPAPGTRVAPDDAASMPKIVTPNVTGAVSVPPGANHYRLVGLELLTASTYGCQPLADPPANCFSYALLSMDQQPNQPLIDSITVDRCYLHGSPTMDLRRAMSANGSNIAIIDSYISDVHLPGFDTQAIGEWYSPGPMKIVNNFLSAASEDLAFGGAGGINTPWLLSDVEVRNNHLYKPLSWVALSTGSKQTMLIKNNLEFKHGHRVLIDGNLLENIWPAAQGGFSLMLTVRTGQSGLIAVVDDFTITNNIFKNVSSGFDITEFDNECHPANGCTNRGEAKRIVIYNNLILLGDTTQNGYTTGYAYGGLINKEVTDLVVQHNTVVPPPNLGYCKGSIEFNAAAPFNPPVSSTHNVWILDNAFCRQINGPAGMVGQFPYVLSRYMGDPSPVNSRFRGNVFYAPPGDKVYALPPHNYSTDVKPKNSNGSEYRLSYPAKMETTDGQVAGVDKSKLTSAYSAESGIKLPHHSQTPAGAPEAKQ